MILNHFKRRKTFTPNSHTIFIFQSNLTPYPLNLDGIETNTKHTDFLTDNISLSYIYYCYIS